MAITVDDDIIYVDDGEYSFNDIYEKVKSDFNDDAQKAGNNFYYFNYNIVVGKNTAATLKDLNVSVWIDKENFQIHQDSTLQLGELIDNKPANGCKINMPNVKLGYGFGCSNKDGDYTLSGDLYIYDSYLDIFGFWGFFNDPEKQKVEIIDTTINGFGRFSGKESVIENVIFVNAHKKYGTISTLGAINKISNIQINHTDKDNDGVCFYFNGDVSGNCLINNISLPGDYKTLLYCEEADNDKFFTILNTNIENVECDFKDEHSYLLIKNSITLLPDEDDYSVQIFDSSNNKIDEFNTNDRTTTELLYRKKNKDNDIFYENYKVIINNNIEFRITPSNALNIPIQSIYKKMRPLWDTPFFYGEEETIYLGDLYSFIVKSYSKPEIKLYKTGNGVMCEPDNITEQSVENLWKVTFLIGELGEETEDGEKWVDGVYYLKGIDNSSEQVFTKVIYIRREEEKDSNKTDVNKIINLIKDTSGNLSSNNNGGKIIM